MVLLTFEMSDVERDNGWRGSWVLRTLDLWRARCGTQCLCSRLLAQPWCPLVCPLFAPDLGGKAFGSSLAP